MIARLQNEKGVMEYLKCSEYYKDNPDISFILIGDPQTNDPSGVQLDTINNYVDKKAIIYMGYQEDIYKYITNASCVVLPSYREGMSTVLLEASAHKRPIITTRVPGCEDIIKDSSYGILCEPRDYKSLLQAKQKNLIGEKYVDWVSKFDHPFQKIDACLSQELDSSQIYEPWLMPGDALIFDKFVVHRSSPFLPGNLRRRRGIALRVIPSLSVFDRKRFYPFAKHILQLASYDSSLLEPEKRDWFFERLLSERLHHGQELLALSGLLAKI